MQENQLRVENECRPCPALPATVCLLRCYISCEQTEYEKYKTKRCGLWMSAKWLDGGENRGASKPPDDMYLTMDN